MIPFSYRRISEQFIDELSDTVLSGESLVLLGSRFVGKRYLMRRLRDRLKERLAGPIIELELLVEPEITTEERAEEILRRAIASADVEIAPQAPARTKLFQAIEEASRHRQGPLILFAANVDGMTYQLAQLFLQGTRVQVEEGRLIAVLSGERDFRDLVFGPNSEFTCANQFVIQGYEEDEFSKYFLRHSHDLAIEFESPETMASQLWRLSGGNIHTLRAFLLWLVEKRAPLRRQEGDKVKDTDALTSEVVDVFSSLEGPLASLYNRATQSLGEEPYCWDVLMDLIRRERTPLVWVNDAPTQLELAGVAVREPTTSGVQLRFASPLMTSFIRRYYDDRRFGNLYAGAGDWDKAFEQYLLLDPEKTIQPSSFNERAEVSATIGALCSSLYSESTKHTSGPENIAAIESLFTRGCRYVLGFSGFHSGYTTRGEERWAGSEFQPTLSRQAKMNANSSKHCYQRSLSRPSSGGLSRPGIGISC
ncbi:MAG TPA: hypothetical protein VK582_06520 [Pyrinomonadaceae bacterium]|nr:hypothetical protein [Pyrinomonadaceae bacterium]